MKSPQGKGMRLEELAPLLVLVIGYKGMMVNTYESPYKLLLDGIDDDAPCKKTHGAKNLQLVALVFLHKLVIGVSPLEFPRV